MIRYLTAVAYVATVPVANWMINNVGTQHGPNSPHVIPVGFGLDAPSGVLVIGVALVLRDYVQETLGKRVAVLCVMAGAIVSLLVAAPTLAVASAVAFTLGELADLAIYTPLRRRNLTAAVLASGAIGAVVDSAVFLWLAFSSLDYLAGNTLGKVWCSIAAAVALGVLRVVRR